MLDSVERDQVAAQFGVASAQIERDYVLSLLLAALARSFADDVIFFGGTALARTHLSQGRLSEDLDLIAVGPRRDLAARLDSALPRALLRGYGRLTWQPALSAVRDIEPASLADGQGLVVKVQLLKADGYPPWPTEVRDLNQRYHDVPPAALDQEFRIAPRQDEWTTQLGQQTRLTVSPQEALAAVRQHWAAVTGMEPS